MANAAVFRNPDNTPLEELKLKIDDGVIKTIPALNQHWVENRALSFYIVAPKYDNDMLGTLDNWKDTIKSYINDLKWLLSLDHHKFWSTIVHQPTCIDMLVSFLQDAYPPYLSLPTNMDVMELYNEAYKRVFIIFSRLISNKEAQDKWMTKTYLGQLIYDKYIFTIPIIWDLCLIYGTTNGQHIKKLLQFVFELQPKYYVDLGTAIDFLKQVFEFVSLRIDNKSSSMLPEIFKGFTKDFGGLQSHNATTIEHLTLPTIQDLVLHILDASVTVRIFLELHPPARKIFRSKEFHMNIINFYENTITKIYEKVFELSEDDSDEIYKHLESMRSELIDTYHLIISTTIEDILSGVHIEENVNCYLTIIMDTLSEKSFIKDYNLTYPIESDLDILCQAYKKMDPVKCDFILQAVLSNYDDPPPKSKYSSPQNDNRVEDFVVPECSVTINEKPIQNDIPEETKNQSLISEVQDILPDLGHGFILKCLQHYNFNTESVINCILEGNLDESLLKLDPQMPIIPEDKLDKQYLETGIERLNIYDNDEFDIMTRDNIDLSKVHKGKKKSKHKDLSDMLNDKSYINEMRNKYVKYSVLSDDDEYDDSYDDPDHNYVGEAGDLDKKRSFKIAPFRETEECHGESEEESDEAEPSSAADKPKDQFCVNPEELRARYQARRDLKTKSRQPAERDVVGKAKGQGQEKDVLLNRQKKGVHKSVSSNHNRRTGAQWKRTQGMMPS